MSDAAAPPAAAAPVKTEPPKPAAEVASAKVASPPPPVEKKEETKAPVEKKEETKAPSVAAAKKEETKENQAPKPAQKTPSPAPTGEAAKANGEAKPAEGATGGVKLPTLREQFKAFSKFGDSKSLGKTLTLSQSDKWMKQAKVIDKNITTTDTAIHFKKLKQMKMTLDNYDKYLKDLANAKKIEVDTLKTKLKSCGPPGTSNTTAVVKSGAVDRLTDAKKFTGTQKARGDSTTTPKGGKVTPSSRK